MDLLRGSVVSCIDPLGWSPLMERVLANPRDYYLKIALLTLKGRRAAYSVEKLCLAQ